MTSMPDPVRELLTRPNIAHVATVMPDGMPHSVPTWIGVDGPHIMFITGPDSQKARNLDGEPRVSISVADAERPSLMLHVRGRVTDRLDGDAAWTRIDQLSHQYLGAPYPRDVDRVVFLVTPERTVVHDYG